MTYETIQNLVEYLPDALLGAMRQNGRVDIHPDALEADPKAEKFIIALSCMDFGWQLVRTLADHHIPFPGGLIVGDDEMLFRAYMYRINQKRYSSPAISHAMAITAPSMNSVRAGLEGCLLAPAATVESAAKMTKLHRDTVAAYEKLFFNVLDRKDDVMYLQRIVYPHGRMVELMDNYLQQTALTDLCRRAGYNNGAEDVMFFMGASSTALEALLQAASAKQLESMIMAFGLLLARNGGMNQQSALPALNNAKQLLAAGKLGGEVNQEHALSSNLSETLRREIAQYGRAAQAMVELQ
jgi:hypothetical protein